MRLSEISEASFTNPEDQAILSRIKERRGSHGILALDKALLHSPPVADGWNTFLGAIRTKTIISTSIRESIICRVAVLNRAWYEWIQHIDLLIDADDTKITREFVQAIFSATPGSWAEAGASVAPTEKHALALEFTDALTLDCHVAEELYQRVKAQFSEREVVEIAATCSAYNCVSRFLIGVDVAQCLGDQGRRKAIDYTNWLEDDAEPACRSTVAR